MSYGWWHLLHGLSTMWCLLRVLQVAGASHSSYLRLQRWTWPATTGGPRTGTTRRLPSSERSAQRRALKPSTIPYCCHSPGSAHLLMLPNAPGTALPLPSARGEVDSNGLNSEEKAESTIGRKIKIIKTNSNCSQRNQFHNFSASLSLLPRLCGTE